MASHHLDDTRPHAFWDNSHPPRLRIQSGDTVVFEVLEASSNQIGPESTTDTLKTLSFDPIAPLTGPVYVEGAEPADALEVEVISLAHKGWGWGAILPDFGLLADDFKQPYLHMSRIEGPWCWFSPHIRIPYEPFCGTMGVAPAEPGRFNTLPPRRNGGNLDIRHLTPGARLLLPVLAHGALFSCGDCHAAQGDGEVNGTAIETALKGTFEFHVRKDLKWRMPRAETPSHLIAFGLNVDLDDAARQALKEMIAWITALTGISKDEAYSLCSFAADLHVTQTVNNVKGVHAMIDKNLLRKPA